jgi:hypothetical protein
MKAAIKKRLKVIFANGDIQGLKGLSEDEIHQYKHTQNLYKATENGHLNFLRYFHNEVIGFYAYYR